MDVYVYIYMCVCMYVCMYVCVCQVFSISMMILSFIFYIFSQGDTSGNFKELLTALIA